MTKEEDSTTEGQVLCQNCTTPIDIRLDFENYGNSALSSMIGSEMKSQISSDINSSANSKIGQKIKANSNLNDILNGRVEANAPMCEECANILINKQLNLIAYQKRCIENLRKFLDQLKSRSSTQTPAEASSSTSQMFMIHPSLKEESLKSETSFNEDSNDAPQEDGSTTLREVQGIVSYPTTAKARLAQAREELISAQEKRVELQKENQLLDEAISDANAVLKMCQNELAGLKLEYNEQRVKVIEGEEVLSVLDARFTDGYQQYKRLKHTNVLNAAFPIWYDGHIGVINGLHLGRLPSKPIVWPEINAALGQCAMLATCLANKFSYTFKSYVITPIGNQSKIATLPNGPPMPLYNSTIRLLGSNNSNFDAALVMYLECIGQLQALVERPPDFCLPYKIVENGRIQDRSGSLHSIKYSANTEENWTRALKMLLIDLKYIVAATFRTTAP